VCFDLQVDSQWTNEDYAGAQRSSLRAKLWSIAGMVAGGLVVTAYLLLCAISILVGASSTATEQENEYPSQ